MTNGNDNKIVVIDNKNLEAWGDEVQLEQMADRITKFLPGNLQGQDALALAQMAALTGANPWRGEIYGFKDWKGKLHLIEGYKLIVRWARAKAEYSTREIELTPEEKKAEGIAGDDIAWWCFVLRDDKKSQVREWVDLGFSGPEAYEMVAVKAVGVVRIKDTINKKTKRPIDPPEGWTWAQVARKRALKNTLNLSHGMPSPQELATQSWKVDGETTIPSDWDGVEDLPENVRDEAARSEAIKRRLRVSHPAPKSQGERVNLVRGPEDQDILDVSPEQDETEPKKAEGWWMSNKNRYLVNRIVNSDTSRQPTELFEFVGATSWEDFGPLYNDVEAAESAAADFKAST